MHEQENGENSAEDLPLLAKFNKYITCGICRGYLIDAVTVNDCLHTFCKSCLMMHLEEENSCPICEQIIHFSYPESGISFDRLLQNLVFKLVPGLMEKEKRLREDFYHTNNILIAPNEDLSRFDASNADRNHEMDPLIAAASLTQHQHRTHHSENNEEAPAESSYVAAAAPPHSSPSDDAEPPPLSVNPTQILPTEPLAVASPDVPPDVHASSSATRDAVAQSPPFSKNASNFHREDRQVKVRLQSGNLALLPHLLRAFLCLSEFATITHLRKYVALNLFRRLDRFCEIDIFFQTGETSSSFQIPMGKEYSMKFVHVVYHKRRVSPINLCYKLTSQAAAAVTRQRTPPTPPHSGIEERASFSPAKPLPLISTPPLSSHRTSIAGQTVQSPPIAEIKRETKNTKTTIEINSNNKDYTHNDNEEDIKSDKNVDKKVANCSENVSQLSRRSLFEVLPSLTSSRAVSRSRCVTPNPSCVAATTPPPSSPSQMAPPRPVSLPLSLPFTTRNTSAPTPPTHTQTHAHTQLPTHTEHVD